MRIIFGIWTMAVALTVSVVAAYYSIIGLTALFAAAVIPVIIMGSALEVAKVTTAIWLHSYWEQASFLMKTYLTTATIVLMFITSMGIFGFLSRAHIEQSAGGTDLVAKIERVEQNILRQEQIIERANSAIDGFGDNVATADESIQTRIEAQERLIASTEERLANDIETQNNIINQELSLLQPLNEELARIREREERFDSLVSTDDVRGLQALVGATADGVIGPQTRRMIDAYEKELDDRRAEVIAELERLQTTENPIVSAARERIQQLQDTANGEIARAQEAINAFRTQLISVTTKDNSGKIEEQEAIILAANASIDELFDEKFKLETDLRKIEVEVGPVKYIAELVYGDTDKDVLEKSVRFVIILIVFVFDPLAIVLVLAGITLLHKKEDEEPVDNTPEIVHTDDEDEKDETLVKIDFDTPVEDEPVVESKDIILTKDEMDDLSEEDKASLNEEGYNLLVLPDPEPEITPEPIVKEPVVESASEEVVTEEVEKDTSLKQPVPRRDAILTVRRT